MTFGVGVSKPLVDTHFPQSPDTKSQRQTAPPPPLRTAPTARRVSTRRRAESLPRVWVHALKNRHQWLHAWRMLRTTNEYRLVIQNRSVTFPTSVQVSTLQSFAAMAMPECAAWRRRGRDAEGPKRLCNSHRPKVLFQALGTRAVNNFSNNPKQCVHPQVPTGTRTQPLRQSPLPPRLDQRSAPPPPPSPG